MKQQNDAGKKNTKSEKKALQLFLNAVDRNGGISYRSRYGIQVKDIMDRFKDSTDQVAVALLQADVANLAVIRRAILDYLLSNPGLMVDAESGVNKMLTNDFLKLSAALRSSLLVLKQFDRRRKGKEGEDLSDILFDDAADSAGDDFEDPASG